MKSKKRKVYFNICIMKFDYSSQHKQKMEIEFHKQAPNEKVDWL